MHVEGKRSDTLSSESKSPKGSMKPQVTKKLSSRSNWSSLPRHDDSKKDDSILVKGFSSFVSSLVLSRPRILSTK
ncbi:unnamed protein product [Eruca vesicaria subsp. sativa]|uniref:Uncharacterized protein n=1 Tax=Eruca vesicaria subsp. sativa TaxID=29727 RepID=A0ABC8IVT5_ERUVS|nr:unnamed protein product [Eruca vesicaria subsp. sativa]